MKRALSALLLAAAAVAPAGAAVPWNPASPENRQVLPTFNYATVESVVGAIRARSQRAGTNPAQPILVVTFPNGRRAVVTLLSCNANGSACRGMGIQSSWNAPANVARPQLAEAVDRFNQRYALTKALITAQGRPAIQRYLTGDFGFIRGDLAVNLINFASQADLFAAQVIAPLSR